MLDHVFTQCGLWEMVIGFKNVERRLIHDFVKL